MPFVPVAGAAVILLQMVFLPGGHLDAAIGMDGDRARDLLQLQHPEEPPPHAGDPGGACSDLYARRCGGETPGIVTVRPE